MLNINVEDWVKIICVGLGVVILLSNFVTIPKLQNFFGTGVKTKQKLSEDRNKCLDAITMWYALKEKCESCGLADASNK